jgi:signal transduction histidine kinase
MVESDLHALLENALTVATHEYKYVADVVRDFAELPAVRCHPGGIGQVVLNLVVNAAHAIGDRVSAGGERGRITVRAHRDDDHVVIAVADTGTGIPEAIRNRVFDPFFTTKEVGKGTGQGLAISWTIITEEHRGQLWFETEMGVGTTFYVRIPLEPPQGAS